MKRSLGQDRGREQGGAARQGHRVMPTACETQSLPSQCKITTEFRVVIPMTHTSCEPLPHTVNRGIVVPLAFWVQALPSQCNIVPSNPTAHTSFEPLPHTPANSCVVPLAFWVQALPSQCNIVPPSPTAHTSFEPPRLHRLVASRILPPIRGDLHGIPGDLLGDAPPSRRAEEKHPPLYPRAMMPHSPLCGCDPNPLDRFSFYVP